MNWKTSPVSIIMDLFKYTTLDKFWSNYLPIALALHSLSHNPMTHLRSSEITPKHAGIVFPIFLIKHLLPGPSPFLIRCWHQNHHSTFIKLRHIFPLICTSMTGSSLVQDLSLGNSTLAIHIKVIVSLCPL